MKIYNSLLFVFIFILIKKIKTLNNPFTLPSNYPVTLLLWFYQILILFITSKEQFINNNQYIHFMFKKVKIYLKFIFILHPMFIYEIIFIIIIKKNMIKLFNYYITHFFHKNNMNYRNEK